LAKRYPLVEVEWEDSAGTAGWGSVAVHVDHPIARCRTAGYLVHRSRQKLVVVGSCDDTNGNVADSMTIPRFAVRSIKRLKRGE
jgi:hypothetical protein